MAAITSNGTGGGNWSATASWTGASVPIEGDTVIIQNGDTITIDQDITVGADTTTAAIDVASGGILEVLHTAAANYTLTCKGDLKTSSGGTIEFGTVANPIPAARIFTVKLNYSAALADGKYGFINNGDMVLQGASKVVNTLLTSDLLALTKIWTIGDTTGWKVSDKVGIASTDRSWNHREQEVIQTIDSTTQITCVANISYAHSGTSPTQAEVINLTRNIVITSYNTSHNGYVYCPVGSTSNVDYVEFYMLGYNFANKHGVNIATTAIGATSFQSCSVWGLASGNRPFYLNSSQNVIINNCTCYDLSDPFRVYNATDNTITNNIMMGIYDDGFHINRNNNTIENNTSTSNVRYGFNIYGATGDVTSFDGNTSHSNLSYGFYFYNTAVSTAINNMTSWRNNNYGIYLNSAAVKINNIISFGNTTTNIQVTRSLFQGTSWSLHGDTTYSTDYGLRVDNKCIFPSPIDSCDFGTSSGIKTTHSVSDITITGVDSTFLQMVLINSKLSSGTQILYLYNTLTGSYVQCEDLGQVAYADKAWYRNGIVVRDASTYKYGSYATRFDYQYNKAEWLEYETYIPIKDGEQIVASAWLRKNASYTDTNRPKLTISGQGITEDSDQMSDVTDTWERVTVSGTPTRTGLAKLTISTYLVNAGASAWVDFQKTDVLSGVLNTIEGDFWANGHIAEVFMDTGSITASEFWETLTSDVDTAGSFAALFKDYIDTTISGRAPANEYDTEMAYIPANLGDVATAAELNSAHGSGAWTSTDVSGIQSDITAIKNKTDNLPSGLAKNEALPNFEFLMVLSSDHITGATGKTISGQISKDGSTFVSITNSITEIAYGRYIIASGFTQDEMNADVVSLRFTGTDCDPRDITIKTT